MKLKLLLPILLLSVTSFPIRSQNVSTKVEKKGILIENFTGIHCGFCPQGHEIIRTILAAKPDKAYSIAVHAGPYATPNADEPDFIIDDAVAIHDGLEVGGHGYPSGTVNRSKFGGGLITSRGDWTKNAKAIHSEDAPVNLYLESSYNSDTRELSVKVEGYYTADVAEETNYLSVAYLQNNIIGPQSGGGVGSHYVHKHMLRGYITPVWGDEIANPKKGDFFTKEYKYTIPQSLNEVPVDPYEIELVAFVTASKENVLNVTGGRPSYPGYTKPLAATLLDPEFLVGKKYAYNYFEAQLANLSSSIIEKASFELIINGAKQSVNWSGNIPPFSTRPIRIDVGEYAIKGNNTFSIELTALNDQDYQGNSIAGSFSGPAVCSPKVRIEIQTDYYAEENRFVIRTRDGELVKEFGPYPGDSKALYTEEVELEYNKIYSFDITDEWADGIQQPRGYIKLYDDTGALFFQSYDIKLWGERIALETSQSSSAIHSVDAGKATSWHFDRSLNTINLRLSNRYSEQVHLSLFSINGRNILQESQAVATRNFVSLANTGIGAGVYLLKISDGVNNETIKICIY